MCQRRLCRQECNQGLLLLLLAGVLLLFPSGSSVFPGCDARFLPTELLADGGTREIAVGHGGTSVEPEGSLRRMAAERSTDREAPHSAPSSAPHPHEPAPAPHPAPLGAPAANTIPATNNVNAENDSGSGMSHYMWAFLLGPIVFVLFLAFVVIVKIRLIVKERRRDAGHVWKKGISFHESQQLEKYNFSGVPSSTVEDLEAACEEFTNIIGKSSDCQVYKGTRISDGLQVAVTRMRIPADRWTAKREIGFRHKVEDLARMSHDNLVNLVAYCACDSPFERMLVFEYASNGTLYEHLHAKDMGEDHLDWAARMRIIMGAACGLEYLHHTLVPPTSHFKFDSRTVFLTEDCAAKLADFAIAPDAVDFDRKSLGRRKSFKKIVKAVGCGDWDPVKHTPNMDSNIRSFGVFLLEVITGRPPWTQSQRPLIEWASEYYNDPDKMEYLVDNSLKDFKKAELAAICDAVKMCLQSRPSKLPTMHEVAEMLSKALKMSREAANKRTSPLLWAEMELLNSFSADDMSLSTSPKSTSPMRKSLGTLGSIKFKDSPKDSPKNYSPKHRSFNSQGSGKLENFLPKHRSLDSQGSGRLTTFSPSTNHSHSRNPSGGSERGAPSPLPKISIKSLSSPSLITRISDRLWPSNPAELELLSPQDPSSGDDQEAPLAASINSTTPRNEENSDSFGRSFRRVWAENSTEMSKLDFVSARGGRQTRSDSLGR